MLLNSRRLLASFRSVILYECHSFSARCFASIVRFISTTVSLAAIRMTWRRNPHKLLTPQGPHWSHFLFLCQLNTGVTSYTTMTCGDWSHFLLYVQRWNKDEVVFEKNTLKFFSLRWPSQVFELKIEWKLVFWFFFKFLCGFQFTIART